MIDVTFLLLVFFLVTLNFHVLEGRLDAALPKDSGTISCPPEPPEKMTVTVFVAEPGRLAPDPESPGLHVYQGRRLRYEVGAHRFDAVGELQDFLATWKDRATPISVDPREGTTYGDVIPVVDAILAERFEELSFAGTFEQDW